MNELTEILMSLDWSPLWISFKTGIVATVFSFFLGLWAARTAMKADKKIKAVLDGLLTLPMVLPPTVAGFFLLLLFSTRRPFGAMLYESFGIRAVQTWLGCIFAATVISFPDVYKRQVLQTYGFISSDAGLTFVTFACWASYFLYGATPKGALQGWASMIVGIISAIIIYVLTDVLAGQGLNVAYIALPVSYTHLDVYKRQELRVEPVVAALAKRTKGRPVKIVFTREDEFMGCLLYTSNRFSLGAGA